MRELQKTGEYDYRQRDSVEHEGYVKAYIAFHGEKKIKMVYPICMKESF